MGEVLIYIAVVQGGQHHLANHFIMREREFSTKFEEHICSTTISRITFTTLGETNKCEIDRIPWKNLSLL